MKSSLRPLICTATTLLPLLASAQQAPRALPVDDAPKAVPVAPATPVEPDAPAGGEKGPEDDLFEFGTLAFTQKDYELASQNFLKYLSTYPKGKHTAPALFRLAESYRALGRPADGIKFYRDVVDRFPKSEYAANSAYWLGVTAYNAGDFKASATYFGFCADKAPSSKVKLAAGFYKSEAYREMKDSKKQLEALQPVLAVKQDNDYLDDALLSAATVLQAQGKNKDALPMLVELIDASKDPIVQGNAALKAAIIQGELKQPDEAIKLYERVLSNVVSPAEQRGAALVGVISELYAKQDYDGVMDTYSRNATVLPPPDLRPRMLMHVANAQRMKKSYARAVEVYNMIVTNYAENPLAYEAAYWRLFCAYQTEDRRLEDIAIGFLKQYGAARKDDDLINNARLLLADHQFNKANFKAAAETYGQLNINKLQERFRASTLFHKGWSESEAARHSDAIDSFSRFIKGYPSDKEIPRALAKRGLSYKESQSLPSALEDFSLIIKEHPESEPIELAYYMSGQIHYEQRNWQGMITDFETLLKKFPSSPAAAEACYKAGSGYIELKDVDKALPLFREAVKRDEKTFGNIGTQKILLCLWTRKEADTPEVLGKEVDAYRAKYTDAVLVPRMMGYLGLSFFERKDYQRSARYLTWAATPDTPENTEPAIWNYLGQARLENKEYKDALEALNNFLKTGPEGTSKAVGLLAKARAQLGMGDFNEAIATAEDGLKLMKDGPVQGQLLIVSGDALLAQGDKLESSGDHNGAKEKWKLAATKYVVPSQVLDNDEITPQALDKSARAQDRLGDKAKADDMRNQLRTRYPAYVPAPEPPPPPPPAAPVEKPEDKPAEPKARRAEKVD